MFQTIKQPLKENQEISIIDVLKRREKMGSYDILILWHQLEPEEAEEEGEGNKQWVQQTENSYKHDRQQSLQMWMA